MDLALKAGLNIIAISDHDTTAGVAPALAAAAVYPTLAVVPAVEINCDVAEGEVHVLGYFLDYEDPTLTAELQRLRESRVQRGIKMVAKLNALGLNVRWERVQAIAGTGSVGRPHVAQALLEAGLVTSVRDAFTRYIGRNCPAYVEREKITPVAAVRLVARAHGIPVLAHPADIAGIEQLIPDLRDAGLAGMEVYYGTYSADVVRNLLDLAGRYGLLRTGGSDFHGIAGTLDGPLGQLHIPEGCVTRLFAAAGRLPDLERLETRLAT